MRYRLSIITISALLFVSAVAGASSGVSTQSEWDQGNFSSTSADRSTLGILGLGYLNGSNSGQSYEGALNNGSLIGYWRMDADSDPLAGSFDVKDYSGQSNNGTIKGGEGNERGKAGVFSTNGFDFDGGDDYVEIENLTSTSKSYTFVSWARSSMSDTSYSYLMDIGNGRLIFSYQTDTSGKIGYYDGSWQDLANTPNDGKWHMVAFVLDNNEGQGELFIDGQSKGTGSYSGVNIGGEVHLGRAVPSKASYYEGNLDEVRLYDRALSNESIQELYLNGLDGVFNGTYESKKIQNNLRQRWTKLNVNVSNLPDDADLDAQFRSLDSSGQIIDEEIIQLSEGNDNYSLSVTDSKDAQIIFNGTSTNASQSWEVSDYEAYHKSVVNGEYIKTFKDDKPRSFFANNTEVRIRTDADFPSEPTIAVMDSQGNTVVDSDLMTNLSGVFEYNFTVNNSQGWYDLEINGNKWENVLYLGEKWQGNYTDADGNKFIFRRELNISEPGIGDRWFEPIDANVDFGFSPDNDSVRVLAWNGSKMLEIPSQLYNVTKADESVSNANLVFFSSLNQSENRTYYVVSAKSEYQRSYEGLNNTDNALDTKVENAYFRAFFNQSMGYLMRDVEDKLGTEQSLSGTEPLDFYPELSVGLTSFKARIDNTAQINATEGPLFSRFSVEGNMNDVDSKPFSVECSVYAANPYMLCEKNLSTSVSETWSSFFFNGLVFEDGRFSKVAYSNSSNDVTSNNLASGAGTDYNSLDNDMRWVSFFNDETGDGVAELFLEEDLGPTNSPVFQIFDDSSNDYFRQRLISSGTSVSAGDYWYTKTARLIYNGMRGYNFVNQTYNRLETPVSLSKGSEITDDQEVANFSRTGNASTNDASDVKIHSYWKDDTFLDYAEINITGNGVNGSNTQLYYNSSYEIRDSGDFTNQSWVNVTLDNSTVNAGKISANFTVFDVAGKSNSTLIEFNVSDAARPEYQTVLNAPNSSAQLDPDQRINVTANITEYSNVSKAYLYYKNDSASKFSRKLMSRAGEENFVHTYKSNFTPSFEDNYTYYISTNDTLDQVSNSSKANLTVAWDYTWDLDSNFNGAADTFNTNVSIGNFTINNTGDFNQSFKLSAGVFNSRTWINGSKLPANFEVGNGTTEFYTVNATTRDSTSTEGLDSFNLTIENSSATPQIDFSSFDVTTSTGGPFLQTEITEYESTVTQGDTDVDLTVDVTNKGNETANTVNVSFELPTGWSVAEDKSLTSENTISLDVGTTKSFSTKIDIADDASTGAKILEAISKSQQDNRSASVEVTVETKSTDNGGDEESSGSGGSSSGGGGSGGGGGSAGVGGSSLTSEQQQTLFQTDERFEIVRGQDQSFTLKVENPFAEGALEDVSVNVTGFLSQYLRVEPQKIDRIQVNDSRNFTIYIEAPRYFSRGEYSLKFNITGVNNQTEERPAGNSTILVGSVTSFKDNRDVELVIHEISREEAVKSLNSSERYVEELDREGVLNAETRELLSQAREALNSGNYQKARRISQQIQANREQAETATNTIQEVNKLVEDARYRGLESPKTNRMVSMATAALKRGDYSMAANRADEAKNLYALETKGEVNYLNLVQRKWRQVTLAMVLLALTTISGFYRFRLFRINRKLARLRDEEGTLLGLMKQVQRESFEEGKMSMEEYEEAMMQYEKQLSQNVKDTVRLESEKAHWANIRKGSKRFEHERDRVEKLMQKTQKQYLEEGEIETRVYNQKMESFRERLTELEGKLAEMEAQKQIDKKSGFKGSVNNIVRRINEIV